jgi:predicted dehydrogenase
MTFNKNFRGRCVSIRVAVVGAGNIGNIHGSVYLKDPLAELVGYCDIIPEKARKSAERDGVKWWPSVKEMLADSRSSLDAVSICTAGTENGGDHCVPTLECMDVKLHVLGEKPISSSIQHARLMAEFAEEKEICYGINLNHRFTPPAAKAKEWVESGRLGPLLLANMTMWINNPNESSPWFHIRALHPHSLDVLRYFCGPVRKVHAFFHRAPRPDSPNELRNCWSNVQVNLLFESGVVGHLTGSYDAGAQPGTVRGDGGRRAIRAG